MKERIYKLLWPFYIQRSTGFIVESPLSLPYFKSADFSFGNGQFIERKGPGNNTVKWQLVSGLVPLDMLNRARWFGVHFESVKRFQTWAIKAFKKGYFTMGKIVIEGQKMTLQYSSPRFYWSIGDLTWRTCRVVCRSLGRSLVMPKRSPAKRDFRDNGERKIKRSKESASSSTSKVDEDLVRYFCLFSVMAPLFTFSRIRGKLIWLLVQLFWNEKSV